MTLVEFRKAIEKAVPTGTILENPGGGTSRITSVTKERISYIRGSSTMSVKFADLFSAYESFRGNSVSSTDLRKFAPGVFDSTARPAGHSCNCTFLFGVLKLAGLAAELTGSGVRGDPYSTVLYDPESTRAAADRVSASLDATS